jgi:hypothetical protein
VRCLLAASHAVVLCLRVSSVGINFQPAISNLKPKTKTIEFTGTRVGNPERFEKLIA